jgi:hypothetical protein
MLKDIEPLIKLSNEDKISFDKLIKQTRKAHIQPPKDTAKKVVLKNEKQFDTLLQNGNISECIEILREKSYEEFLKEEAIFNGIILSQIANKFTLPKTLLYTISESLQNSLTLSKKDFFEKTSLFFGEYAGAISPYIYHLSLSNTQSRRSRAGKTFEGIIYFLYEYFQYDYDAQSTIGKKAFSQIHLGKVVDSILPSKQAFLEHRTKTIVGSMKTTLRERWQEVVEEISRSNLPNIYLLTIDDNISENKVIQMSQHNIILVVPKKIKEQQKLISKQSVIDFETYFLKEIPLIMDYWRSQNV